jgi:hypothetical protein
MAVRELMSCFPGRMLGEEKDGAILADISSADIMS